MPLVDATSKLAGLVVVIDSVWMSFETLTILAFLDGDNELKKSLHTRVST